MKLTKKTESEVWKVYDTWIHSYLNGDVETYDSFLDNDYHFIGSTNNEEFLNRKNTTKFFADTGEQFAGKTELRNETKTIELFEDLVFVTHIFDAWFLNGKVWNYYARFRFSSALRKNKDGWRFIYQHFSIPDAKTEEGETIGYDKINEENQELREAIKRRTVELESKNRELEIEGALQRIRAQAIAMNKSSDLLDIVVTMRNEFTKLGHEAHYFWHMMWLPSTYEKAMTSGDGTKIGFVMELPRHMHGDIPLLAKWEKSKKPTVVYAMEAQAAIDYVDKMVNLGEFKNIDPQAPSHDDIRHIGGLTFIMARTTHGEIGYSLPGIIKNPPSEDLDILVQFASAFDLAHRRFLDLQKAESQAREVQIELALEKVRSRTMAMQRSEELADVSSVLFQQVKELGIEQWTCGFNIWETGDKEFRYFPGGPDGKMLPSCMVPLMEHPVFREFVASKKRGDDLMIYEKEGDIQKDHYKYMLSLPGIGDMLQGVLDQGIEFPDFQIDHIANFEYGNIVFITYQPVPEMHDVFKRFAKVFEQTYTRFLDLQKAEAQAREAQIEASLERIRSRSMAMQKSSELLEAGELLWNEITKLGIDCFTSGYVLMDDSENIGWNYTPNPSTGKILEQAIGIPHKQTPPMRKIAAGWKKEEPFSVIELTRKQTIAHQTFVAEKGINFPFSAKELIEISPKEIVIHTFNFKQGYLMIIGGEKLAKTQIEMMLRFTKVFQQTYTRFLDLQKAEAQTRTAQINLAVERVRAKALAMHKSEEIMEVVAKLKEEVMSLDIPDVIAATIFLNEGEDKVRMWDLSTLEENNNGYEIPFDITFKLKKRDPDLYVKRVWDNPKDYFLEVQEAKDFKRIVSWLRENYKEAIADEVEEYTESTKLERLHHAVKKLNNGKLVIDLLNTPSEEMETILTKMGAAFDLAYKRFEDLQKAEDQTKEARIEASLEKVRTVALSLTKSEDMLDIAKCLYEQLLELGFTEIRNAIIDIHNEEEETFLDYDYSHDMSSAITKFSFYGDPVIEQQIKKVKSSNDAFFEIELKGKELNELIETRLRNGEKDDPRLHKTDHLTYNLYSFGNGAIGISNFGILDDEKKKILKRFRNVFTFAYKRYTDLTKAEAQAREAKIESGLEKVRSEALSMIESTDLLHIAKALYEQLVELGFNDIRNAIIDVNNEDDKTFMDYDYSHEMGGTITLMSYDDDPTLEEQLRVIAQTTDGASEMVLEGQQLQDLINMRRKNGEAEDPRLHKTDSVSYILYAFGNGAVGISNFGILSKDQKNILDRFRNVFTFAYQRFTDLQVKEEQSAKLLDEKQRLEKTLKDLQDTQKQLIQSEKMASLGELTAGIAHEIQNPLNFVNNFSEVSKELLQEMLEEIEAGDMEEAKAIMKDIVLNLEKINHHGKRADGIVKGMLQHSRASGDKKEPTNINALTDEYFRLAYHGLRAKDKSFNATLETDYDKNIKTVNVISQDIGRVILNLFTNAFYAVDEKKANTKAEDYKPTVSVITKKVKNKVVISVIDNGNGIPKQVIDKIFQPFFTTKPTGKGTGLGLSMSYDIIKAHDGELIVNTVDGEGTEFIIHLPISASTK